MVPDVLLLTGSSCEQETGNQQVVFMELDLASLPSVRGFAQNFLQNESRLDLLINNAGQGSPLTSRPAGGARRTLSLCPSPGVLMDGRSEDGFGSMFAVNHLGHFLLTLLLLERLESAGSARVVTVASSCYRRAELDLSLLMEHRDSALGSTYSRLYRKYCNSKLCNILFTWELSRRLQGSGVTCYSLHPGQQLQDSVVLEVRTQQNPAEPRLTSSSLCRTHQDRTGPPPRLLDQGLRHARLLHVLHGSGVRRPDHPPLCPGARHRAPQRPLLQPLLPTAQREVRGHG